MSLLNTSISQSIKKYAQTELGIDQIGFCNAEKIESASQNLKEFLNQSFQGEMQYLQTSSDRSDPKGLLPGAQSVIVIAINYYREKPVTPLDQGRIARYAWGRDYHKVLKKILRQLVQFLDKNWPVHQHRIVVDTAPLLEKAFAEKAGIGFYGRNTTLISPELGSFILLGEIITTLSLDADAPRPGNCGTCQRCLDACPTQALLAPGKMDARRCISYLTLESKQPIPAQLSPKLNNLIAGCDLCQEVCPYNLALARPLRLEALKSVKITGDSIPLVELLRIKNTEQFLARFAGSSLTRPKRSGLLRNALNAAKNAIIQDPKQTPKFYPLIEQIARSDEDLELQHIAQQILLSLRQPNPGIG